MIPKLDAIRGWKRKKSGSGLIWEETRWLTERKNEQRGAIYQKVTLKVVIATKMGYLLHKLKTNIRKDREAKRQVKSLYAQLKLNFKTEILEFLKFFRTSIKQLFLF